MQPDQDCGNVAVPGISRFSAHSPAAASSPRVVLDCHGCEWTCCGLLDTVTAFAPGDLAGAFDKLESHLAAGRHAAGYFAYELGYAFERRLVPLLPANRKLPLLWFGIFATCTQGEGTDRGAVRTHTGPLAWEWERDRYSVAFARIHALIEAGDLYQANLSYRARFGFAGAPFDLYRDLRTRSRAGHCAFVDDGERQILSLSPELFFEISTDGVVRTRPMKGTAARGPSAEEDAAARARLSLSEKERAENLMIVDLLRNDLSRVAEPGSVVVEKLFEVETYPTLHQMVSTVAAQLKPGLRREAIVRALFPCGSVTGAPKLRAMEIIRETETSPRGVYCGAIGCFAPDGSATFNVAIRTLTISGGRGELGIGGAVVHDSRPDAEYDECRLKARYYETARQPLQLIETLRFSPEEGFLRLDLHLCRMASSASALGMHFERARARAALMECVQGSVGRLRVRMVLDENGTVSATSEPFTAACVPWRFAISGARVASRDPLLRHKTSRRELFDSEHARHAASGFDEVIFTNERGELTEGSRSNLFLEFEGRLQTPPLAAGLLDGCLRRELVDQGHCFEALLVPADVARADRVYLGNSLRGLIQAVAGGVW